MQSQSPLPALEGAGLNVLNVQHTSINNLPKPAQDSLAQLLGKVPVLLTDMLQKLKGKSGFSAINTGAIRYEFDSN